MTSSDFQLLLSNTLSNQNEIDHILNSDNSLLVSCTDKSNFLLNILESKRTFIHDDHEEKFANEYIATHSAEDFWEAVLELKNSHPGFLLYFLIFAKLEELGIIDSGLFFHLNDSIVYYEKELDTFTIELLRHVKINDNQMV